MRVIGGIYRHRLLEWPDDTSHIRPTKDRIRESIFNALGDIDGLVFLDLYSGSGAFGIEAISRGCLKSYFVDINPIALKTIKNNINNLKITNENAFVFSMSDVSAIETLSNKNVKVDILFMDPPYKEGKYEDVINLALSKNLLKDNAIIVTESDHYLEFDNDLFKKRKDYKYGEIFVSILWRQ